MQKTVIGIYKDFTSACAVVRDLNENGFPREQIEWNCAPSGNLPVDFQGQVLQKMSPRDTFGDVKWGGGVGMVLGGVTGLLVGLVQKHGDFHFPPSGMVWLTIALGAFLAGMLGSFLVIANALRNPPGGSLITVRTEADCTPGAIRIMNRYSPLFIAQNPSESPLPMPAYSAESENFQRTGIY